jgi:hypothetical protein
MGEKGALITTASRSQLMSARVSGCSAPICFSGIVRITVSPFVLLIPCPVWLGTNPYIWKPRVLTSARLIVGPLSALLRVPCELRLACCHPNPPQDDASALFLACQRGHLEVVKLLVAARAPVNAAKRVRVPNV